MKKFFLCHFIPHNLEIHSNKFFLSLPREFYDLNSSPKAEIITIMVFIVDDELSCSQQ